jgi:hypothetical protein
VLGNAASRLALAAPLLGCLLAGAVVAGVSITKVTYLAGAMVYADVGALDGVQPGDTLRVIRGGARVAMVKVTFVSSHRAACDTLWTDDVIRIGDELRFTPHAIAPAVTAAPAPGATERATAQRVGAGAARRRSPRIRGRIGGRYLAVETGGTGFRQPALDLRLDGYDQGGGHVDVSLDVRNRQTVRTAGGGSTSEAVSRVYRAMVALRTVDSHLSLSVGRQTSASLASVSLFDGALLQLGNERHSFGLFGGTQPDPGSFGPSREIFESGGFVEFHSAATSERRFQFSLGGIASQQGGQPNRDFAFTQGSWSTRKLMINFTQELDFNRGWKLTQGEAAVSPTSTFLMMRLAPIRWLGINTGYDNRRNVRLYRDRTTPADQFDDAYRQGAWAGGDCEVLGRFRISGETRINRGAERSQSWSGGAEAYRITSFNIALRGRISEFAGSSVTSRLILGGLGFDPVPRAHVEMAGGMRGTRLAPATTFDDQQWESINLDLSLGRRWYMNSGFERDHGGSGGSTQQIQGSLSLRF